MKNSISTFFIFLLALLSVSSLFAQGTSSLPSLIGESLNPGEMHRIKIEKVVPLWHDSYPDSLVILETTSDENLSLLAFFNGQDTGQKLVLPSAKKQQFYRLVQTQTGHLQTVFDEISNLLLEEQKVAIIADMVSGDNVYLEVVGISEGYLEGFLMGTLVKIGWWEFGSIRLQEDGAVGRSLYNPNSTRYLFAPSAIPLKKGEGYYQNVMIGLNSLNYGLTDYLSISAGLELFSSFSSLFTQGNFVLGFVNVKTGFQVTDKLHLGAGVLAGGAFLQNGGRGAIGYGLATYGSPNSNITVGAGLGKIGEKWKNDPVITINGMHMINRKVGLVTENWINLERGTTPLMDGGSFDSDWNYISGPQIGTEFSSTSSFALSGGIRIISGNITFDLAMISFGQRSQVSYQYDSAPVSEYHQNDYRGTFWFPVPLPFLGLVYKF